MWAVPENAESLWVSACRATFDVNGGGKVDHMGGSIVGLRLSTFRKTVPSTVIYEVDQQPVEGEMDVPSGDVRARSPGLPGGGDERSGNLPGVRPALGHGTQDADLLGAIRLPVPKFEPYTGVIHAILEADAGFGCRANQRGNLE